MTETHVTKAEAPEHLVTAERLRAWLTPLPERVRVSFARAFATHVVKSYWGMYHAKARAIPLSAPPVRLPLLPVEIRTLAMQVGRDLAFLPFLDAGYRIGCLYTICLPDTFRSRFGVYYTPPALTIRLLQLATEAGADWRTCKVLDPGCGGAAFLAPIALRMAVAGQGSEPGRTIADIGKRLVGFEVDPFAAWISQLLVEVAMVDICAAAGKRLPKITHVRDSLVTRCDAEFDVVIGNPPYGRINLSAKTRAQYARSLYGHANLYGLFTDFAVRSTKQNGVVALVTPTSMLAGQYYKKLRQVLGVEAPPVAIDVVQARWGVFADVLQETMLAVYRKDGERRNASVCFLETNGLTAKSTSSGTFCLPQDPSTPWLLPRATEHSALANRIRSMHTRLSDYGYSVSTGPLVWNRHKSQLRALNGKYPVIWAEAVASDGTFEWRAQKRNHVPWITPALRDNWVVTNRACILVQRTTAKEQHRRLIAAELPLSFIRKYGGVVVENHLNMIYASSSSISVPLSVVAALLNSPPVDSAFRCINGSVAVSAYELEALPLPTVEEATQLRSILERGDEKGFHTAVQSIYAGEPNATAGAA